MMITEIGRRGCRARCRARRCRYVRLMKRRRRCRLLIDKGLVVVVVANGVPSKGKKTGHCVGSSVDTAQQ